MTAIEAPVRASGSAGPAAQVPNEPFFSSAT